MHVSIVTRRVAVSGSWSQLWQLWCPSHAGCGCRGGESSPESRRQPEPSSDTAAAAVRPSTPSPHLLTETFSDSPVFRIQWPVRPVRPCEPGRGCEAAAARWPPSAFCWCCWRRPRRRRRMSGSSARRGSRTLSGVSFVFCESGLMYYQNSLATGPAIVNFPVGGIHFSDHNS